MMAGDDAASPLRCYAVRIRVEGDSRYLAWYSLEHDGYLRDDGRVLARRRVADLREDAARLGCAVDDGVALSISLDALRKELRRGKVPASLTLNAWNMLGDLASTVGLAKSVLEGDDAMETTRVYDKVFFANNLPSITPAGRRFRPQWTPDDLRTLRALFSRGATMARRELGIRRRAPAHGSAD
jgi:hypothetical protein